MKRVMEGSVTVKGLPALICSTNRGTTEPREHSTLPYLVPQMSVLSSATVLPHGVDRIGGLVGGEADDFLHPCIDAGRQDVVGADDVGLHRLHGKELAGRYLLQGGGTEDEVHSIEGIADTAVVAYIADVVLDLVVLVEVTHVVLLLLVAAEDADSSTALPKEPVPPVMRMVLLVNITTFPFFERF